jgi:hypothetical protein
MTETLTKVVVDCSTGIETVLPLTAQEIADLETLRANAAAEELARQEAEAAKAAAKASAEAKLAALGLSTDEIAAL